MTRLVRVAVSDLQPGQSRLSQEASHYLVDVHRAVANVEFLAFDVQAATVAIATLLIADSRQASYRVDSVQASSFIPEFRLVVIQAFGKGAKVDQVVRDATALDASEIWVVSTSRSARAHGKETQGRCERWRRIAVQAARQSERGNVPSVEGVLGLREVLSSLTSFAGHRFVLSPWAVDNLGEKLATVSVGDTAVLVGPEGGFDDAELALARESGFTAVRLGCRVLRTEIAAVAALGAIAAFRDLRLNCARKSPSFF
jgi:16S rRNA (uracil1498-N3)-methyltransferase